ncbi:hypothetical protein CMQ_5251 [Grosmannia clavigera kw1407]|uniref:Uncharacterized protein n=1 Tax=Grosmannia clavigera (strain kw1407 / UAMH 11150) TaxID=655863 RepID=F0XBU6_GROCL|nr:uncharacterized protein CMQ_5251 [Grosmannia clavigera kw1407]EFX04989.1 hypothetical protein CMQ_5251 [Grosmannia clavigera kw1407]
MQLTNPANLVFHREGGLQLTDRFKDGEWPAINPEDWKKGGTPIAITFSSGSLLESPILVLELVRREGDATGRVYTDAAGLHHWVHLPSYGVIDPESYLTWLRTRIPEQVRAWATTASAAHREALRLADSGLAPELLTLLSYDFGRNQKTRSSYLTGANDLGIPPLPRDSQTLPGRIPLPRIVTAQCDNISSIYLASLLEELFGDGNGALSKRLLSKAPLDTHIGYVALRMLIQGTIWILVDKKRRDVQNNTNDPSLEVRLQGNLQLLVSNFIQVHRGTVSYSLVRQILSREGMAFHGGIEAEKQLDQIPETDSWKNALFWLPALEDLLVQPHQVRLAFGLR